MENFNEVSESAAKIIETVENLKNWNKENSSKNSQNFDDSKTSPKSPNLHDTILKIKRELIEIIHRMRNLTQNMHEDAEELNSIRDWKFAALVIDRVCLLLFSAVCIVCSCAIVFAAPRFNVNL